MAGIGLGGGSSPVKTEPPQIVLLLLLFWCCCRCCRCCRCCFVSASCVCMSTSHARATQSKLTWPHAQPGDVGLRVPQMASANPNPVLNRSMRTSTLMHPPCLGINVIKSWMLPNSQSLPNTWPRLNPQGTVSCEVCWIFLFSRTLLTPPPGPLTQSIPPPPSKPGGPAGAL